MAVGPTALVVVLLAVYMVYSFWARLDPRYPLFLAAATLLAAMGVELAGYGAAANDLAIDTFLLAAAGVVLIVVDRIRAAHADRAASAVSPGRAPAEATADPAGPR